MDCYCWKTMGPEGLSRKTFKIKTQWTRRDLDKNSFESKTVISAFIIGSIQVMFPEKNLQN
jgi:hypothetical protein